MCGGMRPNDLISRFERTDWQVLSANAQSLAGLKNRLNRGDNWKLSVEIIYDALSVSLFLCSLAISSASFQCYLKQTKNHQMFSWCLGQQQSCGTVMGPVKSAKERGEKSSRAVLCSSFNVRITSCSCFLMLKPTLYIGACDLTQKANCRIQFCTITPVIPL